MYDLDVPLSEAAMSCSNLSLLCAHCRIASSIVSLAIRRYTVTSLS